MIFLKLFLFFLFLISNSLNANDVKIIELHKNKSLDQLVLESDQISDNEEILEKNELNSNGELNENLESDNTLNAEEGLDQLNGELSNNEKKNLENSELVVETQLEQLFDIDEKIIQKHLDNINDIKSETLKNEFINILSNPQIDIGLNMNNKIYYVIHKLYNIGEIGRAYSIIKDINLDKIENIEHLVFFQLIELNYLLSTFKLSEVCELKTTLIEKAILLPNFLLEKTDIFCLTLENKFPEAKLLNSLLLDSEKEIDENFQNLFNFMVLNQEDGSEFNPLSPIKSKELIFLYSAMLRINELPLDEDFINIDPMNLSIPVILSDSTRMDIRIKAANRAFYEDIISIDSLSALYQSVDFNNKEFSMPDQTILSLKNNNELIMAFYYQLANVQIFPEDRLKIIIDYWKFAKNVGLEKIAYFITNNILESFTPTSENRKFGIDIALAHIANNNYIEANRWISLIENSEKNDQIEFAKFLIELNESDNIDTIINYLKKNSYEMNSINNQQTLETIEVLVSFLNIEMNSFSHIAYDNIIDNRLMPSYFVIKDINNYMKSQKDLSLFLLSLISMNNKRWVELHPEHLILILNSFSLYNQGSLIKPILLEILDDVEIIK